MFHYWNINQVVTERPTHLTSDHWLYFDQDVTLAKKNPTQLASSSSFDGSSVVSKSHKVTHTRLPASPGHHQYSSVDVVNCATQDRDSLGWAVFIFK